MLRLGKLLPHQHLLFSCGDHVIFTQTIFEGIAVFAVKKKQTQRVCSRKSIWTELYFCVRTQTDCSAFRSEKASIGNMSFFFINAVEVELSSMIYNVGSPIRFAHKYMLKRSKVIVESLTGVLKVDLGVRPDPGSLLIGLIMPYGWAQDHDVLKELPVGASEQIQDENCFFTSRLSEYRRRMGRLRQEVDKPLRRTGHLQY